MSETVLTAETGRRAGSSAPPPARRGQHSRRRVRPRNGSDPGVSVDRRELRLALSGAAGLNTVLDLTVDGTVYPSLIKDIQRHPVRRTVQHIDFIQVNLNEEIIVSMPVRLEGEAKAVMTTTASSTSTMQRARGPHDPAQHPRRDHRSTSPT